MNGKTITDQLLAQEEILRQGGSLKGRERQKKLGRLTARERIAHLLDDPSQFFELSIWAAYEMYEEVGPIPCAGVIAGIGTVSQKSCMIIANDATVKAGAMFPQSVKKMLRAQKIALSCRLPILYLVDSSGVFLPMQDEIFPDEDDFGRIFRNNAIISAAGIPQYAAIMGSCIAGGGYLPVLCDALLMTEGSGLYLAGPHLVKAAIGQEVDAEHLGGAKMHASISGTVDFLEKTDSACLARLKKLVDLLPTSPPAKLLSKKNEAFFDFAASNKETDIYDLLDHIIDKGTLEPYKKEYGKTLACTFGKINGQSVGIVANQKKRSHTALGEVEIGGVIYSESADKAARFVMLCNQMKLPLIFVQDVVGFMVGVQAESSGIIRRGAKLVNAISNSVVPKITLVTGNSFGAGNYALCGKAYDPDFILAWPGAKMAVMGKDQATHILKALKDENFDKIAASYEEKTDIRYGAARGWVDAIIDPSCTKNILSYLLSLAMRRPFQHEPFHTGVMQV